MSTEWLNAIESLRKIGVTKVCIVVALTIVGLLVAGDSLGKQAPELNTLWSGWAPSILVGAVAWVTVSIVEGVYSELAKRVLDYRRASAVTRCALADARDDEAQRQALEDKTRAIFEGLSEHELLVLRSFILKSTRALDWNITYVRDKEQVTAAINSLVARQILDDEHWLDQELYYYLLEHPDVIGSKMPPRKVWNL